MCRVCYRFLPSLMRSSIPSIPSHTHPYPYPYPSSAMRHHSGSSTVHAFRGYADCRMVDRVLRVVHSPSSAWGWGCSSPEYLPLRTPRGRTPALCTTHSFLTRSASRRVPLDSVGCLKVPPPPPPLLNGEGADRPHVFAPLLYGPKSVACPTVRGS